MSRTPNVNSFNDWDPLEEIIVGDIEGANLPEIDISTESFSNPDNIAQRKLWSGPLPQSVIEETQEDLQTLTEIFGKYGVRVRRPDILNFSQGFGNGHWQSTGMSCLMPRDSVLIVGNEIIETPMGSRARYHETFSYRSIFLEYFKSGVKWSAAPKPRLLDTSYRTHGKHQSTITNDEPLFDAANVLRIGEDIIVNLGNTANLLGAQWLRQHLGERFRVHTIEVWWDHIDTTLVPLRPGTLLVNPERVKKIPEIFKSWEILLAPDPVDIGFGLPFPLASAWIGMNVLSINEKVVLVEENQKPLIQLLRDHKFEALPVRFRHGRTLGGGLHCVTLDTKRAGASQRYL